MAIPTKKSNKGLYNSSLTRVYPLFGRLIACDRTGVSWLPKLLQESVSANPYAFPLPSHPGRLLPEVVETRKIGGNILKYHGVNAIEIPCCFEKSIPPSYRFLRWLIENPDQMTWPDRGKAVFSLKAQSRREDLLGYHGKERQEAAQQEALEQLETIGAKRAHGKWWSFEGTTSVDCFLETENLILLIEGKRTESLSASIYWFPGRDQLVRNLEVAQELAGGKQFAVLVIAESKIGPPSPGVVERSLPHFSPEEREGLIRHFLGCLTWKQVCEAVDIPYGSLPETVPEWIKRLR